MHSEEHIVTNNKHPLIFDIECYPNYFQCAFKSAITGKFVDVEMYDGHPLDIAKLKWIVDNFCVIGFNSLAYDTTILALALAGKSTEDLKEATVMLIEYKMWSSAVLKQFKVKRYKHDHIDIMPVAPISGSLKIYGGRNGTRRMQDLPFPPETNLSREQMSCVRYYCANDLNVTGELWDKLAPEMALRKEMSNDYDIDLRSKSDAQIAEAVIKYDLETLSMTRIKKPDINAGTIYRYKDPGFIFFQTPMMQEVYNIVLNTDFVVNESGSIQLPERFNKIKINIGEGEYNLQIGGLHSKEKSAVHVADKHYTLEEQDVTSYYPFIILNQGLFPQHLGPDFLKSLPCYCYAKVRRKVFR